MTRDVNEWLNGPHHDNARGRWIADTYGDELYLLYDRGQIGPGIWISLDSRIPAPDCAIGTPANARELGAWIMSAPWLSTSALRSSTIEAIDALELDVSVAPGALEQSNCAHSAGAPNVPSVFVVIEIHEYADSRHPWPFPYGQKLRLFLFDRFSGSSAPRTIVVAIAGKPDAFEETVADAMPTARELLARLATYEK